MATLLHSTFFPNGQNALPTAKLQMIRHALLNTNQAPVSLTCHGGLVVEFWPHKPEVGGLTPNVGGGFFNLKNILLPTVIWKQQN